jgi:hypothetical protein
MDQAGITPDAAEVASTSLAVADLLIDYSKSREPQGSRVGLGLLLRDRGP